MVKAVRERGIPVISEIEFAGAYTSARTICITGSNGKTTTTTLTYEILAAGRRERRPGRKYRRKFRAGGGHRQLRLVRDRAEQFPVGRLLRFPGRYRRADEYYADHLDRYDYELQNYVDSKFRILRNQRPEDRFIYCADDPLTLGNLPKHPLGMQTLPFSVKTCDGCAAMLADGVIRAEVAGKRWRFRLRN